jgi:hypothetical protein
MNMNEPKPKQGTDFSVDLPIQLHPQMKDVEPKLSTASDEQRLVAGTSAVDLQTRRLSGAQRKRPTRERKMREGTWTAEKPPGKSSSSQVKRMAEGSGSAKRPHSDSSTPSQDKQQTLEEVKKQLEDEGSSSRPSSQ